MNSTARRTRGDAPGRVSTLELANLARALGHPARIDIVNLLLRRDTCIGCDVVEEIGLAQSTTSEHLRILKDAGIVIGEIERPRICYSLNPAALAPLRAFLERIAAARPTLPAGGGRC